MLLTLLRANKGSILVSSSRFPRLSPNRKDSRTAAGKNPANAVNGVSVAVDPASIFSLTQLVFNFFPGLLSPSPHGQHGGS